MRALVQWARSTPADWTAFTPDSWLATPKKPDPTGRSLTTDEAPGWVSCINVQGLWIEGFDHYAIMPRGQGLVVVGWRDDPAWVDEPHAYELTFLPLRRDERIGGAWNTDQHRIIYAVPGGRLERFWTNVENTIVIPWAGFAKPDQALVRHGVWLADDHHVAHKATRGRGRGTAWRDWTEGVPADELVGGRIPHQRLLGRFNIPKGTKTYYCRDTAEATGAYAADYENAATTGTATAGTQAASIKKDAEELAFTFSTPSGEPGGADWPSGTYDVQLDSYTGTGADITFGCLTIGSANGEFARLDSTLATRQEGAVQSQGAFSGTGLKYASNTTWDPSAGNASDRFTVVVAAGNTHTKDAEDLVLELNESDDYTSGPWSAGTQNVTAQVATVTTASQAAGASPGSVNVAAVEATVTGSSQAADVSPGQVTVAAVEATVTAAAQAADTKIITTVAAVEATATAASQAADVSPGSVNVAAVEATVSAAAQAADVNPGQVSIAAVEATVTAAAQAADTSIVTTVPAVEATVSAASQAATVDPGTVQVATQVATTTAAAQAAAVSPGQVTAPAVAGTALAVSQAAAVSPGAVQVVAAAATAQAAAQTAAVAPGGVSTLTQVASAQVASQDAGVSLAGGATAQAATVTASSQAAGASPGSVGVDAAAATATAAAQNPAVALLARVSAQAASCTVEALAALVNLIAVLSITLGVSPDVVYRILAGSTELKTRDLGASPDAISKPLKTG